MKLAKNQISKRMKMSSENSGFIYWVHGISDKLNKLISNICVLTMASMTIVVLLGVVFRYVFQNPLSWSEELSRYLMIWAAAMAISIGIKDNEHVGLTVLLDNTKSTLMRSILGTAIFLVTLSFLSIMTYYSILMVVESQYQISQSLGITMVLPTLVLPISMISALIQLILSYILNLNSGMKPVENKIIDI